MSPPPQTPSRYNLRRRPSTATPAPRTPRMLQRLDADQQLVQPSPSEPRVLRSATKKPAVTSESTSVSRPTPKPRRPSTAPIASVSRPASPSHSASNSKQPSAADTAVTTPQARRGRPSTAPPSDRVLRSASRNRHRDQSQEPTRTSSRNSEAQRSQLPSTKRLTARARAFLPRRLNSDKPEADVDARPRTTQQTRRARSRSSARSQVPQIENSAPDRDISQTRSRTGTIRTRSRSNVAPVDEVVTEGDASPNVEEMGGTMRRLFHGAAQPQSSSPNFSTWLYLDLVEECKKNGLPYRGKKDEIISRLHRFHTRAAGALSRTMERNIMPKAVIPERHEIVDSSPRFASQGQTTDPERRNKSETEEGKAETQVKDKTDIVDTQPRIGKEGNSCEPPDDVHKKHDRIACKNALDSVIDVNASAETEVKESLESSTEHKPPEKHSGSDRSAVEGGKDNIQLVSVDKSEKDIQQKLPKGGEDDKYTQHKSALDNAARLSPETNESPEQRTDKIIRNTPPPANIEENVRSPSTEKHQEQTSMPIVEQYSNDESMHPPIIQETESGGLQDTIAVEHKDSYEQTQPDKQNEQQSATLDVDQSSVAQTAVSKESKCREAIMHSSGPETPLSPSTKTVSQVDTALPSKDAKMDTYGQKETVSSADGGVAQDATAVTEKEQASKEERCTDFCSNENNIEAHAQHHDIAVHPQDDKTEANCEMVNNAGAIQFHLTREPISNARTSSSIMGVESEVENQAGQNESKNKLPTSDEEQRNSSLPYEREQKHVTEGNKPPNQRETPHSPVPTDNEKLLMREAFSRWKRPPSKKEEDAQTPDVIDLDAESDGNDEDDEDESRNSNSESHENSADEDPRPEIDRAVDEDEEAGSGTQQPDVIDENKLEDTDEDNDEDEDESSEVNKSPSHNEAFELRAVDNEPLAMDVTFSEQGEEHLATNSSTENERTTSLKVPDKDKSMDGSEEIEASPLEYTKLSSRRVAVEYVPPKHQQGRPAEIFDQNGIDIQEGTKKEGSAKDVAFMFGRADNIKLNSENRRIAASIAQVDVESKTNRKNDVVDGDTVIQCSTEAERKGASVFLEATHSSSLKFQDDTQKRQVPLDESGRDEEAKTLESPDLNDEEISFSSDEQEHLDNGERTSVAQKGLILPQRNKNQLQNAGNDLNLLEEVQDESAVDDYSNGSSEQGHLAANEQEPSHTQTERNELGKMREQEDLDEFSESPLPSPYSPRNFVFSQEDDVLLKPVNREDPEPDYCSPLKKKEEFEAPRSESLDMNTSQYQIEALHANPSTRDASPVAENRSQSDVEMDSVEEDEPSENLSSHEEESVTRNLQHERIASSNESTPESKDSLDSPSSKSAQNQSGDRCEEEAHRQDDGVICSTSSDDGKPVPNVSQPVSHEDVENNEGGSKQGQILAEGGKKEECQSLQNFEARHTSLNSTASRTPAHVGESTSKIVERNHSLDSDRNQMHFSVKDGNDRDHPLSTGLIHRASHSAKHADVDDNSRRISSLIRRNSVYSASATARACSEKVRDCTALNSVSIGKQSVGSQLQTNVLRKNQAFTRQPSVIDARSQLIEAEETKRIHERFSQETPPVVLKSMDERQSASVASHENSAKRSFRQLQDESTEDHRPRKIPKRTHAVEFAPMPTPERTIYTFGQKYVMNQSENGFRQEHKPLSILDRLKKMQEEEQRKSLSTFKLPPLSATWGQMYKSEPCQPKSVMFRQGSVNPITKKHLRRSVRPSVPEFDKQAFMEESRKRLEAHKRSAPSLRPSQSPFITASNKSFDSRPPRVNFQETQPHRSSQAGMPKSSKRVTFPTENISSKRRRGLDSR